MNQTIFVTAELRMNSAKPRSEVIQTIKQYCLEMESEAGCLQAIATFDEKEPRRAMLWERYEDRAAIDAHFTMPHTQAFIASDTAELVQFFETTEEGETAR